MIIDANTWIGPWPFALLHELNGASLAAHLKTHGIHQALVSPLNAVFHPEPGPGNERLLREIRRLPALIPVPIINPTLANWREELAAIGKNTRVRAVRLLPNYHNYRLRHPVMDALVTELHTRNLGLIVNMRLIDERHEYFALKMKGVPGTDLAHLLLRHPKLSVLATGLGRTEILDLAPKHPNLLADFSYAEWHDTLEHLLGGVAARQLVFGSLTPFLITAANVAKLKTARLPASAKTLISSGNLQHFLAP